MIFHVDNTLIPTVRGMHAENLNIAARCRMRMKMHGRFTRGPIATIDRMLMARDWTRCAREMRLKHGLPRLP